MNKKIEVSIVALVVGLSMLCCSSQDDAYRLFPGELGDSLEDCMRAIENTYPDIRCKDYDDNTQICDLPPDTSVSVSHTDDGIVDLGYDVNFGEDAEIAESVFKELTKDLVCPPDSHSLNIQCRSPECADATTVGDRQR